MPKPGLARLELRRCSETWHQLATEMVLRLLPTRLKIIDPQEHSHEERCAIIDAHTLTTIPTTFVFLAQPYLRFLERKVGHYKILQGYLQIFIHKIVLKHELFYRVYKY